jgi:cysteine desulfurase
VGALIGADADEIVFTSGATEANNLALLGLAQGHTKTNRRRILLSAIEHKSVLAAADAIRDQFGHEVEMLPVDSVGRVPLRALEDALDEAVLVVSIMAVNNEIGTIQELQSLSAASRSVGALFHTDAAQAPLALDIAGIAEHADLVSLSAHKMLGPPGIGALYVRGEVQRFLKPLIHGGGQQHGLRSGTLPLPLCVGMGAAAELIGSGEIGRTRTELRRRRDDFLQRVRRLPWKIRENGPTAENRHPGNANICFRGFSAHDILQALQPALAASTGSACTSGVPAPSHVLRAIGLSGDDADSSIRFSLGFDTRDEDVEAAVELIARTLDRLSTATTVARSA